MRKWEIKFDEEQKKREEELIRKLNKNSEEDKTNTSEENKTNDNYEEKN